MIEKLKERRGEFLLDLGIKLLISAMLLSAGVELFHVYHTLGAVREKVNEAVLAVAAVNVAEFYGGARESDGFARHPEEGTFTFSIATDDVVNQLVQTMGATDLSQDDTITVGTSVALSEIRTQYINYSDGNLHFSTELTVTIPLRIGGILLPDVTKGMEVRTSYDPKF